MIYFVAFPHTFTAMSDDSAIDVVKEGVVEGSTRAAWEGSDVTRAEIDWLIDRKSVV